MSNAVFKEAAKGEVKYVGCLEKDDYRIDVIETEDTYEAWIYKKNKSTKICVSSSSKKRGTPQVEMSLTAILIEFEDSYDEFIEEYEDTIGIIEAAHYERFMKNL